MKFALISRDEVLRELQFVLRHHTVKTPAKSLSHFYFAKKKCDGRAGLVCVEVDDNIQNLNQSCRNRTVAQKQSVTFNSDVFASVNKSTKQKSDTFNMPARVNEFGNK